jgi:putative pyruvate formate lyase activating enzyme
MGLRKYRSVARGTRIPAYLRTQRRRIGALDPADLSADELWEIHGRAWSHRSGPSRLDLKIELAERMLRSCTLCERKCQANRLAGETGFCGVGADSRCFFEQTLWAEEAPVVPSHEVFLTGCNLRCRFCYAWEWILDPTGGSKLDCEEFARLIDYRRAEGAANLNLLGGEPTVNLPAILKAIRLVTRPTAIVWNSNFMMSRETMRLLDGVVDLYLGDFRFGNDRCAAEIAGADRYFDIAARNFKMAGMSSDLIIRHLLLPGHVECCLRPIAEWVAANLPGVPFHLMMQYLPFHQAVNDPILGRALTSDEEARAGEIVRSLGLNTTRWNRALYRGAENRRIGSGEIRTTINIGPDGRVSIMHLHSDLRELVAALQAGGE